MVKKVFHRNEWYDVYYSSEEYKCLVWLCFIVIIVLTVVFLD